MRIISHLRHIFLLAVTLAALSSCRTHKPAPTDASYPQQGASLQQRYDDLCASYGDWTDLEVPVRLELRAPVRFGLSGKAYMRNDEYVYISLRMMGFEVATIFVDNDSVRLVDKYHKKYLSEGIDRVLHSSGLTLSEIQDALLGRAFEIGKGTIEPAQIRSFLLSDGPDAWALVPKKQPAGAQYGFTVSKSDNALATMAVAIEGHEPATATYSRPYKTALGTFCCDVDLAAVIGDQTVSAAIEWDLRSARWDTGATKQWKQPSSSYQRLSASQILKSLRL